MRLDGNGGGSPSLPSIVSKNGTQSLGSQVSVTPTATPFSSTAPTGGLSILGNAAKDIGNFGDPGKVAASVFSLAKNAVPTPGSGSGSGSSGSGNGFLSPSLTLSPSLSPSLSLAPVIAPSLSLAPTFNPALTLAPSLALNPAFTLAPSLALQSSGGGLGQDIGNAASGAALPILAIGALALGGIYLLTKKGAN